MTKNDYRTFFALCRPFIKFNFFLKKLHISNATFSRFLNYSDGRYDGFISINRLDELYNEVYNTCLAVSDMINEKIG